MGDGGIEVVADIYKELSRRWQGVLQLVITGTYDQGEERAKGRPPILPMLKVPLRWPLCFIYSSTPTVVYCRLTSGCESFAASVSPPRPAIVPRDPSRSVLNQPMGN